MWMVTREWEIAWCSGQPTPLQVLADGLCDAVTRWTKYLERAIKKRLNNPQISCRLSSHFDPPISYIPVCFSKKIGFRSVYSATPLLPQSIHPGCCFGPNASPGRSSAVVFPFVLLCCFEVKFCLPFFFFSFSFLFLPLFKASAMFGREGALRLNRVVFFFFLFFWELSLSFLF